MRPAGNVVGEPGKADVNKFVRADHVTRGQCKALPRLQFNLRLRKFADADLRPLCVGQQRNGKPQFLPDTLDRFHTDLLFLVRLMRKIDARNVHPRKHQGAQHVFVVSGRSKCTDDLRFPHIFLSPLSDRAICGYPEKPLNFPIIYILRNVRNCKSTSGKTYSGQSEFFVRFSKLLNSLYHNMDKI